MRQRDLFAKIASTLAILVANISGTPASAGDLTLAEIVKLNTVARGGKEAIEAIEALELEIRIEEPTFVVSGIYRVDRKGRMRIDIYDQGQRVFTEGYNNTLGWQWQGGEEAATRASESGEAALRHGPQLPMHIVGLHELSQRGHRVELGGREVLDGVNYYVVKATLDDGYRMYYFIDPESWLIVRSRSFRAFHPDVDPKEKWHETRYSDFRNVAGTQKAYTTTSLDMVSGDVVATTTIKAVRVNPELDSAIFDMP